MRKNMRIEYPSGKSAATYCFYIHANTRDYAF